MTDTIVMRGMPELQRALIAFNRDAFDRLNRKALRKAANFLKQQIKAATPVAQKPGKNTTPGLARDTLKVYKSKFHGPRKDGIIGLWIGWRRGTGGRYLKGAWPKTKTAYYMPWVEHGYNHGSRRVGTIRVKALRALGKSLGVKSWQIRKRGILVRHGGTRIEGKNFFYKTARENAQAATDIFVRVSNEELLRLAQELNFNVS